MTDKTLHYEIAKGVNITENITDRFKEKSVTVYFVMPSSREKIASYVLIPKLLASCCKKHPTIKSMNNMLAMNYGMRISGSAAMIGDNIALSLNVSYIGDEYVPSGEKLSETAVSILLDCIFDPAIEEGEFDKEIFENFRRMLTEKIASKIDNKQKYAITRLKEIMCPDEPFGIGDQELIRGLSTVENSFVVTVLNEVIKTARIEIITVGDKLSSACEQNLKERFSSEERSCNAQLKSIVKKADGNIKSFTDKMNVTQGKLAMGLRSTVDYNSKYFYATKVMADIFGGGTYSLLFSNVREKMSLCYYCGAGFVPSKGIILIQSGVDIENFQKARTAILSQLEDIKKGNFSDELISNSKRSFENFIKSVYDTPDSIENWCFMGNVERPACTPEEYIKQICAVTKEEIIKAAAEFELDAEYYLTAEV